jgi:hypothetical protein
MNPPSVPLNVTSDSFAQLLLCTVIVLDSPIDRDALDDVEGGLDRLGRPQSPRRCLQPAIVRRGSVQILTLSALVRPVAVLAGVDAHAGERIQERPYRRLVVAADYAGSQEVMIDENGYLALDDVPEGTLAEVRNESGTIRQTFPVGR